MRNLISYDDNSKRDARIVKQKFKKIGLQKRKIITGNNNKINI